MLSRVGDENDALRAEVSRLQRALEFRETQLFAVTGVQPEEEEY